MIYILKYEFRIYTNITGLILLSAGILSCYKSPNTERYFDEYKHLFETKFEFNVELEVLLPPSFFGAGKCDNSFCVYTIGKDATRYNNIYVREENIIYQVSEKCENSNNCRKLENTEYKIAKTKAVEYNKIIGHTERKFVFDEGRNYIKHIISNVNYSGEYQTQINFYASKKVVSEAEFYDSIRYSRLPDASILINHAARKIWCRPACPNGEVEWEQ